VIGATLEKITAAKTKTGTGKWPAQSDRVDDEDDYDDADGGKDDDFDAPPLEQSRSVHMPEGPSAADHEAKGRPIITAHYDLKTMNRIQQVRPGHEERHVRLTCAARARTD
jgi:hypothetical protein